MKLGQFEWSRLDLFLSIHPVNSCPYYLLSVCFQFFAFLWFRNRSFFFSSSYYTGTCTGTRYQVLSGIRVPGYVHLATIMLAILADILGCDITLSPLKMYSLQRKPILYRINLTSNSPLDFQKLIHLGIKFVSEWGSEHHLWHIHTKPDVFLSMSTFCS